MKTLGLIHTTVVFIKVETMMSDILEEVMPDVRVINLAVAGRSVSCDHLSQASLRGAATCMATGHAAGVAAAHAAKGGCGIRDVDVAEIQDTLSRQGAVLGRTSGAAAG